MPDGKGFHWVPPLSGHAGQSGFSPPSTVIQRAGMVHVIFGGQRGLTTRSVTITESDFSLLGGERENFDALGEVLAVGNFIGEDLDGRPCDDLAIGMPSEDLPVGDRGAHEDVEDAGQVWILIGGPDRLVGGGASPSLQLLHQGVHGVIGEFRDLGRFGKALAVGDFDDNGYDDLAVDSEIRADQEPGASAVWVFSSSSTGLDALVAQGWAQYFTQNTEGIVGDSESGDHFGAALAVCDVDGDGFDDIAIGCCQQGSGSSSNDSLA